MLNKLNSNYKTNAQLISNTLYSLITYSDNDCDTSLVEYEVSSNIYSNNSYDISLVEYKVNSSTYTNNSCSTALVNNVSGHYSATNYLTKTLYDNKEL
ncbi:20933_t:CDS:2 [Cetraspora pellucida]|uniref:20933_t:CDS:1 n=1 Tax=Cetraspora pellucida TaxID=1433469 RepID=A0A9N9GWY0_9GLOM|nr:20933_t:CDS:2 [Cetraspora pellucida]